MNKYYTHPLVHPLRPGALPERAQIVNYYHENGRAVAALVMDLDALELPQVAALMAEHGVRV